MAHILLVDDQLFTQDFFLYELDQMGHEVSCVKDGHSLFIFLEEQIPDLILLDPNLNGFQGWDLLQEIKRPDRPHMPTLLFTSFGATLRDPRADLAEGYVVKSVDTQDLKKKVSEVLNLDKLSVSRPVITSDRIPRETSTASQSFLLAAQGDKDRGPS